jgi:hypothetical protein
MIVEQNNCSEQNKTEQLSIKKLYIWKSWKF